MANSSSDGEKIISELVNRYVEDGHYENVKGIYRWDKMTPSFPTLKKQVVVVEQPVFNGKTILPQKHQSILENELEIPKWDTFSEEHMMIIKKLAELFDLLKLQLPMQVNIKRR